MIQGAGPVNLYSQDFYGGYQDTDLQTSCQTESLTLFTPLRSLSYSFIVSFALLPKPDNHYLSKFVPSISCQTEFLRSTTVIETPSPAGFDRSAGSGKYPSIQMMNSTAFR